MQEVKLDLNTSGVTERAVLPVQVAAQWWPPATQLRKLAVIFTLGDAAAQVIPGTVQELTEITRGVEVHRMRGWKVDWKGVWRSQRCEKVLAPVHRWRGGKVQCPDQAAVFTEDWRAWILRVSDILGYSVPRMSFTWPFHFPVHLQPIVNVLNILTEKFKL